MTRAVLPNPSARANSCSAGFTEREASAERSQIYPSDSEGLMSSSSQSLNFISTGKLVAWLSHQKRLSQDAFSEGEQPADILRGNESIFRDANPANVAKISS